MDTNRARRNLIRCIPGALLILWTSRGAVAADVLAGQNPPPNNAPPIPNPFGKDGQVAMPDGILGPVGTPPKPPESPRKDLKSDDKDLRKQVQLLAQYADELKKEVERTDSTKVLSVQMMRRTQDIEKLAHHIATLAAG
jgi:hypothetical protein